MRIETLNQRIENAKSKIEKKQNTIIKKTNLIAKKEGKCEEYEISWLKEDIKRLNDEITETKASLAKYEKQLVGELEKESMLINEIPESMKRMQTELVNKWDEYDIRHRAIIEDARKTMSYDELCKTYSGYELYNFAYQTDEQIHKNNMDDAKAMILNLYNRVKAITGEVTDWDHLSCVSGNMGAVLNGYVIGKEGRAEVETILAGGYNIQKLHVRTLVHER